MQSIERKESLNVTANRTTRSVAYTLSFPQFDEYREIKHILKETTILKIFNAVNELAMSEAAKSISRTLVRHADKDLSAACYAIFCKYPLYIQRRTLEFISSNPSLLEMFSFHLGAQEHYAADPTAAKVRKPRKSKIATPSADITNMLAEVALNLGIK